MACSLFASGVPLDGLNVDFFELDIANGTFYTFHETTSKHKFTSYRAPVVLSLTPETIPACFLCHTG